MSAGRWDFCTHCGSIGWVDWGYSLHMELGTCPAAASWRGMGEEVIDRARDECDRLNDLEAVADPEPVTAQDLDETEIQRAFAGED